MSSAAAIDADLVRAATRAASRANGAPAAPVARTPAVMAPWLRAQAVNVTRHAAALRPFRDGEFGDGAASPTLGHLQAVNAVIAELRNELLKLTVGVRQASEAATTEPATARLQSVVSRKAHAHVWVQAIERIWDFYFELFGQRQSRFADWLLSCDRIALDCYQDAYMNLGV